MSYLLSRSSRLGNSQTHSSTCSVSEHTALRLFKACEPDIISLLSDLERR